MLAKIMIPSLALLISACATKQQAFNIDTELSIKEYNQVERKYISRPTKADYIITENNTLLNVSIDPSLTNKNYNITFLKEKNNDYEALITKYKKWHKLATDRKEIINKEIGKALTWSDDEDKQKQLIFRFVSSSISEHYLSISYCINCICFEDELFFDMENIEILQSLLKEAQKKEENKIEDTEKKGEEKDVFSVYK